MLDKKIAVIVPAYNEQRTIGSLVKAVRENYSDVFVVDDGSEDDTAENASREGARLVTHSENLGYDHALYSGLKAAQQAGFSFLVSIDADGQHNPEILKKLTELLIREKADMVLGVRPKMARPAEKVFSIYSRMIYGIPDLLCGVKGYRAELLDHINESQFDGTIGTGLALAALRAKCHTRCVSVSTRARPGQDQSRFGSGLRANYKIFAALFGAIITDLQGISAHKPTD
jgi:glycosyltransferase involved in cell wall biosynthesis